MALIASQKIQAKLSSKHQVTLEEVEEAFADRPDYVVIDDREDHATDPPTYWFIAQTNSGRLLKVCYIDRGTDIYLRTAYPPDATEIKLFEDMANEPDET
jgi:uncharacterized DUF497 family protein